MLAEGVLETVKKAMLRERQIEVECQPFHMHDTPVQRVHPLAIIQSWPVIYLVATAFDYDDIRLYAVHRIKAARLTKEPAKRDSDFDLDAYIDHGTLHFGGRETIYHEVCIAGSLAWVLETPISEDMAPEADGVEWTKPDSWHERDFALRHWSCPEGSYA